jgi:hypothetical protein
MLYIHHICIDLYLLLLVVVIDVIIIILIYYYNIRVKLIYYSVMSIVVMRRKVRENHPRVAPISGHLGEVGGGAGSAGFSINGGFRNLRGIGITRMIGSGGWSGGGRGAGRFAHGNSSWYFSANDSNVIKRSSRSNSAMIDMKYRWIKGGQYPHSWHKDIPSAAVPKKAQSDHIRLISQKAAGFKPENALVDGCGNRTIKTVEEAKLVVTNCNPCRFFVGNGGIKKRVQWRPITKGAPKNSLSQSDYIEKGSLMMGKRNCLSLNEPNKFTHFPIYIRHKGCDVNYLTWQAAVAARALPSNYVGSGR